MMKIGNRLDYDEETSNNIQNFIDSYGMQSYQSVVK